MSDQNSITIVHTGTANLASVLAAFARANITCKVTDQAKDVECAHALVLPGVGSFGAAMAKLREHKLVQPLQARFAMGRSTLAICLGLQLLCEASEETPGVEGLSVLPGVTATKFKQPAGQAGQLRVPQLGWNLVEPNATCRVLERGFAYFANSFKLDNVPNDSGWSTGRTNYAGEFVSVIERPTDAGILLACQFHPELSGAWGAALLNRWLMEAGVRSSSSRSEVLR